MKKIYTFTNAGFEKMTVKQNKDGQIMVKHNDCNDQFVPFGEFIDKTVLSAKETMFLFVCYLKIRYDYDLQTRILEEK